ncbi:MAG: M14 family metallopeptidase [Bacteroidales bacterium]|nr:M14 family metallopeptidase [Bacteroidales bacterium]
MKITKLTTILIITSMFSSASLNGQTGYPDPGKRRSAEREMAAAYPDLCKLSSAGISAGGTDIPVITIGKGDTGNKPAVAIIGGIDSRYIAGTAIISGFAKMLLENSKDPEISALLDRVTFYLLPDINPDATSAFFSTPSASVRGNANPWDEDRDFSVDEDPFEDINGDGVITIMRIEDEAGTHIESGSNSAVMVKADPSKGEKGKWIIHTEGRDNDGDGLFNEDGPGGVFINNNFSFDYEEWGRNAGIHALSENESRAVADFLYDHYNIFAVVTYGPDDNLSKPWKSAPGQQSSPQQGRQRSQIIKNIQREDETINQMVSALFLNETGFTGTPYNMRERGNFAEWAYYHYGRYSFATPGWWVPQTRDLTPEENILKWGSENGMENLYVDWKPVEHPDFHGKKVEVGGIKPFVMTTPPESMLGEITEKNYNFLVKLAGMHPDPVLTGLRVEHLEKDLYRISVTLHNNSMLATTNELGDRNKWNRRMVITLEGGNDLTFISGKPKEITGRLKGNETREYNWVVRGRGEITINAGAVNTGFSSVSTSLK